MNSRFVTLDGAKDVKRYTRKHNNGKKKNEFNYFITHKGITYHLEDPELNHDNEILLSGTLTIPNKRFKEVRDTVKYLPQKRVDSKAYINQVVFKISDDVEELKLNTTFSTNQINYPVEA